MSQQECVDKLCKKHVKTYRKKMDKATKKLLKETPKQLKAVRDKLKNSNRLTKKERLKLIFKEEFYKTLLNGPKPNLTKEGKEKMDKLQLDACVRDYCNPTCKDTYYESGKELSEGFIKKNKMSEKSKKHLNNSRKKFFNGKTSVIKDGFYEELSTSDINKMKKMGAVSGCVPSYDPFYLE
jgi:hypothetical protein